MTVALVHGNPETAAIWDRLVDALKMPDVVRLSPPGSGAPTPPGWRATPTTYRDWLIAQLETIGTPVHLAGHDWGGAHVVNVAMHRPDLLHSWCSDTLGWFEPDYSWHALARAWQTPEVGEAAAEAMTHPDLDQRTTYLTSLGIPDPVVAVLAAFAGQVVRCRGAGAVPQRRQPALADLGQQLPLASLDPASPYAPLPISEPAATPADGGRPAEPEPTSQPCRT